MVDRLEEVTIPRQSTELSTPHQLTAYALPRNARGQLNAYP